MTYFAIPYDGTPYIKYCILERGVVTSIDISRPEGKEIDHPPAVKFRIKPVVYDEGNHRKAPKQGAVLPNRGQYHLDGEYD